MIDPAMTTATPTRTWRLEKRLGTRVAHCFPLTGAESHDTVVHSLCGKRFRLDGLFQKNAPRCAACNARFKTLSTARQEHPPCRNRAS